MRRAERIREAWTEGRLRWLLHSDQRVVYDIYRDWEQRDSETEPGDYPRVFVFDIGRRWGKTTELLIIKFEDCIRNPGRIYRYSCAFQKDIQGIIGDVSRYVLMTCPEDLGPRLVGNVFRFPNGSELRLVGLDMHPNGLRGQACDGDVLSEAAFIIKLKYVIQSVLYPQYQGRPWARIVLESSAPVNAESDYDAEFVEDAKARGAYVYRSIEDNPMLTPASVSEFNRAAGGKWNEQARCWEGASCLRENYNVRVRDPEGSVVPEFSRMRHVVRSVVPLYAHCYVGADPGTRDKFGLVFGYWDLERGKLVIQRSWAERNAGLSDVADVIRETERELWSAGGDVEGEVLLTRRLTRDVPTVGTEPLRFWDGERLCDNPHRRVSDTDARTIHELAREHGLSFGAADKAHAKHAQEAGAARKLEQPKLYVLRQWLLNDRIEIWPDSGPLESQLNAGRWNDQRTDFERTPSLGHLDCLMALVYMLPAIAQNANPEKPAWADMDPRMTYMPKHLAPVRNDVEELNKAFGAGARRGTRPMRVGGLR